MQVRDHVSSTILLPGPNSFNKPKERSVMNDVMKNALIGTLVTIFCCANAYAGGTTGGGGNVALPDQVSDDALVNAVSISKNVVLAWAANSAIRYAETKRPGATYVLSPNFKTTAEFSQSSSTRLPRFSM